MKLTIVLVNYKCDKSKLQSCLSSIKINTDILIIDHSHDFTFTGIKVPKNLNIKVIKNENLGNGAGINCGIKNSNTQYVLYLDIDTILPKNFFEILQSSIKQIPSLQWFHLKLTVSIRTIILIKLGIYHLQSFFITNFF